MAKLIKKFKGLISWFAASFSSVALTFPARACSAVRSSTPTSYSWHKIHWISLGLTVLQKNNIIKMLDMKQIYMWFYYCNTPIFFRTNNKILKESNQYTLNLKKKIVASLLLDFIVAGNITKRAMSCLKLF